jgi:flagella basal body P-ring formation protein FlgA
MTMRLFLIVAGAVAAVLLAIPAWADAILRPAVVVTGDQVRLGDLFDGVGDKANMPVARAPAPGRRVVVDGDWLHHVATMNGIDWKTDDAFLELAIERAGVTIPRERVEQEIVAELNRQGVPSDAQIEIANHDLQLTIPAEAPATIAVRELNYDEGDKRFTAVVEAPADGPNPVRIAVAGRIFDVEDVPALAHPMGRGEVIAARDLTFVHMRADKVRRDVILDADQIIGMTPRNTLRTGQTLSLADLQHPVVVARGALVTVVLHQGSMTLSIEGRANDPGSVGDIIRVTNTRSNQVLPARVDGPNIVSVGIGVTPVSGGIALAN